MENFLRDKIEAEIEWNKTQIARLIESYNAGNCIDPVGAQRCGMTGETYQNDMAFERMFNSMKKELARLEGRITE